MSVSGKKFSDNECMITPGPLRQHAFLFSSKIISLSRTLERQREYVLSKQILKSGTSIGANLEESTYAQSKADYISKLSIALKEASETEYWLKLFVENDIQAKVALELQKDIKPILRMLIAGLNSLKKT